MIKVMWRSKFGKPAPADLEFSFTPLWQMSETDKATNAKAVAETVTGVFEAGITDRKTALEELRDSSTNTGLFSNITDEQINASRAFLNDRYRVIDQTGQEDDIPGLPPFEYDYRMVPER